MQTMELVKVFLLKFEVIIGLRGDVMFKVKNYDEDLDKCGSLPTNR